MTVRDIDSNWAQEKATPLTKHKISNSYSNFFHILFYSQILLANLAEIY